MFLEPETHWFWQIHKNFYVNGLELLNFFLKLLFNSYGGLDIKPLINVNLWEW